MPHALSIGLSVAITILFGLLTSIKHSWQWLALLVILLLAWAVWYWFQPKTKKHKLSRNISEVHTPIWKKVFVGVACGVFSCSISWGIIQALPHVSYFSFLIDERQQVEAQLAFFIDKRQFSQAVQLIDHTTAQTISHQWRQELQFQKYQILIAWSRSVEGDERRELLVRAKELAREVGLNSELADLELALFDNNRVIRHQVHKISLQDALDAEMNSLKSQNLQLMQSIDQANATHLAELESANKSHEAQSKQALEQAKLKHDEWINKATTAYANKQIELLAAWSNDLEGDNRSQFELFERITHVSEQYKVQLPEPLSQLQRSIQSSYAKPRKLSSATARIIRRDSSMIPFEVVDIEILDNQKMFIAGLNPNDFSFMVNDVRQKGRIVLKESLTNPPAQNVLLLLDISMSMEGKQLLAMQQATNGLVSQLPNETSLQLMAFGSTTKLIQPWTADRSAIQQHVLKLKADGATLLFQSIKVAMEELRQRSGIKTLVVFSDGTNTIGGVAPADLIALAKSSGITIFTLGYAQGNLDRGFLNQLASVSGGKFFETGKLDELKDIFDKTAKELTPRFYRLGFYRTNDSAITLQIGADPGIAIAIPAKNE